MQREIKQILGMQRGGLEYYTKPDISTESFASRQSERWEDDAGGSCVYLLICCYTEAGWNLLSASDPSSSSGGGGGQQEPHPDVHLCV